MTYNRIEFTFGLIQEALQEIDEYGNVVRYLELNGDELILPLITESKVIEENYQVEFIII
jgi:hypothetical protein